MTVTERTDSVQSYIEKFHHLWQIGAECLLTLSAINRSAWINLLVNLGKISDGIPLRRDQTSQWSSRTFNGPSQQRRHARRALARSQINVDVNHVGDPNLPKQGTATVKAANHSSTKVVVSGLEKWIWVKTVLNWSQQMVPLALALAVSSRAEKLWPLVGSEKCNQWSCTWGSQQ